MTNNDKYEKAEKSQKPKDQVIQQRWRPFKSYNGLQTQKTFFKQCSFEMLCNMHSRSYKALFRVLLTRTQVVIQVAQWRFKVPDSHVDASEISPRSRALSAPCTFYSFLQLYLEYLCLCIRICIWVFVFVFVNSCLYLWIRICISCTLIPLFSSATFSVKFFLPSSCGHFWLWCWFQMCCCTPVRISHNRERDSSATYHMPNYLWQICPLWSFLWQIIFAHPAPAVWSYSQGFNQGTLVLKGWK